MWADCEALERRHQIGRGSLVVLDWIPESGSPTSEKRRGFLAGLIEIEQLSIGEWQSFPENALFLPPSIQDDGNSVPDFYASLKAINRRLRCDFFEGVVMSRLKGDSQPMAARRECAKAQQPGKCSDIPSNSAATRRSAGGDNRQGARLLTNPFATFWVAVEEEGRTVARLFLASAYDGTRGGVPGLGWQSWQMSQLRGERAVAEELGIGSRMFTAVLVTAPSCGSPQPAMRMVRKSASSPSETISKPCWR